ncbi:helix-turn-helix transcriptional regulator [Endozoicomonas sp. ALC020]|uniref:helix-turn-helix transcriptional regulator n=1 Tax=unclassified Endozoicomonas TaxID=2644528 RepID=UPI003BB02CCD
MTTKTPPRYIRKGQVVEITSLSPSTIERLIKKGVFPASFKLSPQSRINVWLEEDVHQWMEEQANKAR